MTSSHAPVTVPFRSGDGVGRRGRHPGARAPPGRRSRRPAPATGSTRASTRCSSSASRTGRSGATTTGSRSPTRFVATLSYRASWRPSRGSTDWPTIPASTSSTTTTGRRRRVLAAVGRAHQARRRHRHDPHVGPSAPPRQAHPRAGRRPGLRRPDGGRRGHGADRRRRRPTRSRSPPAPPQPSGVHLHWAMPDALMRGSHVEGATSITMPALPDRWVVVRTLLPVGGRLVHTHGWVVDAVKGSVTPLTDYSGTTVDAADGVQPYSPLDGTSGGTLLWSATYEGARNRFALHDDLADLPKLETVAPQGFHAGTRVLHRRRVVVDRGERSARLGPQPARVAGAGGRLRLAHLSRGTRRRRHARRSTAHPAAGDLGAVEPEVDHAGAPVRQVLGALHRLLRDRPARGVARRRGLGPLHRRRLDAVPLVAARQRARRADHGRADRRRRSTGERGRSRRRSASISTM